MRIENEVKLDFNDVLLRPKRSTLESRKQVSLEREFIFRNGNTYKGIPIIAANMDGVGTPNIACKLKQLGLFTCLIKSLTKRDLQNIFYEYDIANNTAITIGVSDSEVNKFLEVCSFLNNDDNKWIQYVCIDVANGYTKKLADVVRKIRKKLPYLNIIAGNVVTAEMVEELLLAGADIIKVGIGSGAVCTTRIKTGVGYPQFSSIAECADAAHGLGGHIISDGGCCNSGDVAKAFGAGADFVMLGSMLAGHDEGGGEVIEEDGKKVVQFYGMSSKTANEKHFGGLMDYRTSEGRTVHIPYKGKIADTVQDILGGVRSACTYVGAKELKHLSKCATFIRVNNTHNTTLEKYTISH
tara:strand:- start:1331 stop:2392 length:1062 start_codon:yes stop_codon:yes gene_type:complete